MLRRINRAVASIICSFFILVNYLFPTISYAEEENLQISLNNNNEIDIVVTVGQSSFNLTNFKNDLINRLASKGINPNKINVTSIQSTEVSAKDTFAWQIYDHYNYPEPFGSSRYKHIEVSADGKTLTFYGYTAPPFKDFMFMPDNNNSKKIFTFNVSESRTDWHTLEGAGYLFNSKIENNILSGYVLLFAQNGINLYQINGVNINNFHGGGYNRVADVATLLQSATKSGSNHNMKIEVDGNNVKVWDNNILIINRTLPVQYGYGFGPMVSYTSHGCSSISYITFSNIVMTTEIVKQFSEVIRQPEWKPNSERFLINVEDNIVPDFNDSTKLGEILTRLMNENISYIALGTNTNKAQAENLIARNNGNGLFVDNSNYANAVEQIAEYIAGIVQSRQHVNPQGDSAYVIVGEPLNISVNPPHLAKNTANEQYPQGRWRIDHDYNYYDNSLGQASWANQWQNDLLMVFDKPGKYEIWFENDKHPIPRYIYAHRKPIANFNMSVVKNGSQYNVTLTNLSYDPDLQFRNADKGIAEVEWKWKESTATIWNDGQIPATLPAGKDYIVQLRVKDYQGEWSEPLVKYITTQTITVPPIASFEISLNPISMYENLVINDTSYDPAGRSITQRTWTIYKNGNSVYTGSILPQNFISLGQGDYVIGLKVKNDANLWSEEFKRPITVTADDTAPEAIVEPTKRDWDKTNVTVNVIFSDKGGSGFNSYRYAITQSPSPPINGWSNWVTSSNAVINITTEGKNYLHIEAKDNAGNVMQRSIGEYQIDKTIPTLNLTNDNQWSATTIINASASDNLSGIHSIKLPDGNYIYGSNANYTVSENGTYTFEAEDNAGNKTTKTITISNIDKIKPTLSFSISTSNWTNQDVIITATATDNETGIKQFKLPNGQISQGNIVNSTTKNVNYTVTDNGEYTFEVEDNAGNKEYATISITNIDKLKPNKPTSQIDVNPDTWIKDIINIKVVDNGDVGGSGVDKIMYRIKNRINGEVIQDWTEYLPNISTIEISGDLEVAFKVIDRATNESDIITQNIKRDNEGPNIQITPNTTELTQSSVVLTIIANDLLSGVEKIKLPNGTFVLGDTAVYTVSENGTYIFYAYDKVGNVTEKKFFINNIRTQPLITNNPNVTLQLNSEDYLSGTKYMRFRNEDGAWTPYEDYKTTKDWWLSNGDGLKYVWVQFKDLVGNESQPIADYIILDTTPPELELFEINDGKYYTNDPNVNIRVKGKDTLAGIESIKLSNDNVNWTTYPYSEENLTWRLTNGDGEKTVYLRLVDKATNHSPVYSKKVYLDMTKPTVSVVINNGDEYTTTREVTLKITYADGQSGVEKIRIIEGERVFEMNTPNTSGTITLPWTLDFGVVKEVKVQAIDKAGNISDTASDTIIVDKLTINGFTLTDVVNPLKFSHFNPLIWPFTPQPMVAGANISFELNVKAPYEPAYVRDTATYRIDIIGDNGYHKVIIKPFIDVVNNIYKATETIPLDAPKGAKIYISCTVTRTLLVSPYDVQTAYFPGTDASTKAQIGYIEGNIKESIKFNEIR